MTELVYKLTSSTEKDKCYFCSNGRSNIVDAFVKKVEEATNELGYPIVRRAVDLEVKNSPLDHRIMKLCIDGELFISLDEMQSAMEILSQAGAVFNPEKTVITVPEKLQKP